MLSRGRTLLTYGAIGLCGWGILLALEIMSEEGPIHLAKLLFESLELFLIIGAVIGTTVLFSRFQTQREEQALLMDELEVARSQGRAWRAKAQKHLIGLSSAIREQFEQWALSPAESEVAMLMLKGFSHKEIAKLRQTSETTIRQQARMVYEKANVKSRQSFCAFFLEDLLLPLDDDATVTPIGQSRSSAD